MKDSLLALRWTFMLAIIPGILAVLTIVLFVKESAPATEDGTTFTFSLRSFDKNFRNYLLIMILFTLGNSSDAFLLFRVQEAIQKSGAVVTCKQYTRAYKMISNFGDQQCTDKCYQYTVFATGLGFFSYN